MPRTPGPRARAGTDRGREAFERIVQDRPRALHALAHRAAAVLSDRPLGGFERLGRLLRELGRDDEAEAFEALLIDALLIPHESVLAILNEEEPALNYRAHSLASLGRRALGLDWEDFAALLRRDAGSFDPELLGEHLEDLMGDVRSAWFAPGEDPAAGAR